jgi:2-phosphosulfolactate phosphatase
MRIDTFFAPGEVDPALLAGRAAVVIDIVRATSVMVEALANGARAIYPTVTTEDAVKLAHSLGRENTLLCGERKGLKVDGFDLGNSPREFTGEVVRGKQMVMSTTNGTRAFLAAGGASRAYAASLLNLSAVARQVRDEEGLAVVCAGRENRFAMDDAVCAGLLLEAVLELRGGSENRLDDASRAALSLARGVTPDGEFFRGTAAGWALVEIGLEDDLPFVALRDRHTVVPEMHDRMIRPAGPAAGG